MYYSYDANIRIEFCPYRLVVLVYIGRDTITFKTYADLYDLTADDMRDLWQKLKIPLLRSNIMSDIRTNILVHLQNIGRVDLVAVCLDSAPPMEDKKRL